MPSYIQSTMDLNTRTEAVVADSTDDGTLRPDLPPTTKAGTKYTLMRTQYFPPIITLPSDINRSDLYALWKLFFTSDVIRQFCSATNSKGITRTSGEWRDVNEREMLVYLGIWIYMGLHYEDDIKKYWSTGPLTLGHEHIRKVMTRDRFLAIYRSFRILSHETDKVYEKVYTLYIIKSLSLTCIA